MAITLKAARVNSGMTQEQIAEKLGISRDFYHQIETGKVADIKPLYIYAFCHLTGFAEDDLLLPERSTKSSHKE